MLLLSASGSRGEWNFPYSNWKVEVQKGKSARVSVFSFSKQTSTLANMELQGLGTGFSLDENIWSKMKTEEKRKTCILKFEAKIFYFQLF